MKIIDKIFDFFYKILDFLLCLLRSNCEYSLKKFLAYFFTGLVFWVVIKTDRDVYDLLIFLSLLLGMREFSKKYPNQNHNEEDKQKTVAGFKTTKKDSEIG